MTNIIKETILGLKYKYEFLQMDENDPKEKAHKNPDYKMVVDMVIETERSTGKNITIWDEEDIIYFLKLFHSMSPNSLIKRLVYLRTFANYIADMENVNRRQYTIGDNRFIDCVNIEKLMKVTINYNEYQFIRSQFPTEYNIRDRLLFSLAWEGLTKEELKYLREEDIEFVESDIGEVALLKLADHVVKIESPDIVQDIKTVLNERTFNITTKTEKINVMRYKDSPYLLKPVAIGKSKNDDVSICHPSLVIKNSYSTNSISCDGIDIERLGVEDIRRSKLIYLLCEENSMYFDNALIATLFNIRNDVNLYWLKQIANIKYSS
jgi:hypothetical protein